MHKSTVRLAGALILVAVLGVGYYAYHRFGAHADFINSVPSTPSTGIGLRIDPASGTLYTGATINVDVLLDSPVQAVSAAGVSLTFSANLQYVSSAVSGSVLPLAVSSSGDANGVKQSGNVLTFSRVRIDTGYVGTGGEVIRLTFKAISAGSYAVAIDKAASEVYSYATAANVLQTVGGGNYTGTDKQVAITISAPYRSSLDMTGIGVKFYQAGTTTVVATATNAVSAADGSISIADPAVTDVLDNTKSYDVVVTAPGYLSRKVPRVTNILLGKINLTGGSALIPGDFDGNNKIDGFDLNLSIHALNNDSPSTTGIVTKVYGDPMTLQGIAHLIYAFNETPKGD